MTAVTITKDIQNANEGLSYISDLKEQGLSPLTDFSWMYIPMEMDDYYTPKAGPKIQITFYDSKWATFFELKWS